MISKIVAAILISEALSVPNDDRKCLVGIKTRSNLAPDYADLLLFLSARRKTQKGEKGAFRCRTETNGRLRNNKTKKNLIL
jgi:hypothetical protein